MTKSIFASKTFYFGLVQIAFGIAGLVFGWIDPQLAMGLITTGFGTIGFRFGTSSAVHLIAPQD